LDFVVFVVADIEMAVLRSLQNTDLNVGCRRLMLAEHFSLNKMLNMDIFVRVKIEDNRIDFSSLLSESS